MVFLFGPSHLPIIVIYNLKFPKSQDILPRHLSLRQIELAYFIAVALLADFEPVSLGWMFARRCRSLGFAHDWL